MVRYLETYLEKYATDSAREVDIGDLIRDYRAKYGKKPIIVIDGTSSLLFLAYTEGCVYGGRLKQVAERLEKFCKTVYSSGGQLVVFFDGIHSKDKHDSWISKTNASMEKYQKWYQNGKAYTTSNKSIFLNMAVYNIAMRIFTSSAGCEVRISTKECDQEIVEYYVENQCLAILAQNTEFLIYKGCHGYLSAKSLDIDTLKTKFYDRNVLLSALDLDEFQFGLAITISGCGFIPRERAYPFLKELLKVEQYYELLDEKVLEETSKYIKKWPHGDEVYTKLEDIAVEVFGDKEMAEQIKNSLDIYWLKKPKKTKKINNYTDDWDQIVKLSYDRLKVGQLPPYAYAVIVGEPYYSSQIHENFSDASLPPIATVMRALRQRIYGILLKEKSSDESVDEYCAEGVIGNRNTLTTKKYIVKLKKVKAIPPSDFHPGLQSLWGNEQIDSNVKWNLFCHSVSSNLDVNKIKSLQPHLIFPTVMLYYLYHYSNPSFLKPFEINAFLIQAVQVKDISVEELCNIKIRKPDLRAGQLISKFLRAFGDFEFLNAVCGYIVPISDACPSNYFDSLLFQQVYRELKRENNVENFNLKSDLKEKFLSMKAIVYFGI